MRKKDFKALSGAKANQQKMKEEIIQIALICWLGYDPQTQQLIKGVIFLIFVALTIDRKALKVIK